MRHEAHLLLWIVPLSPLGPLPGDAMRVAGIGIYSDRSPTCHLHQGCWAKVMSVHAESYEAADCRLRCWLREHRPWMLEQLNNERWNADHSTCTVERCTPREPRSYQ